MKKFCYLCNKKVQHLNVSTKLNCTMHYCILTNTLPTLRIFSTFHSKDVAVVSCKLAYFSQMIGYDFLQIYGWAQDGENSFLWYRGHSLRHG